MKRQLTKTKIPKVETVETYTVIFEPASEGGYTVTVPVLPGCISEGETLEEARERAKEAIRGYLKVLAKHSRPIPRDAEARLPGPFKERIEVAIKAS